MKTISVKVEDDLLKEINEVAKLKEQEQKEFILETLKEATKKYRKYLDRKRKFEEQLRKQIATDEKATVR